jgi:hypothetical protein
MRDEPYYVGPSLRSASISLQRPIDVPLVLEMRAPFLLVDATEFRHQFGPGVMQWRDYCIIPRYGSAGAKKFAFHVPDGFPGTMEAGGNASFEDPAVFPTAWFSKRQNALNWFKKA